MNANAQVSIEGKNLLTAAPLAGLISAIANSGIFFAAHSGGFIPEEVLVNGQALTVVLVIISSFIPTFLAAGVLALISRFSNNAWNIFRNLSLILMVISFINPFLGIPNAPIGMIVALNIMHVVVVFSLLYFFKEKAVVTA